MAGWLGLRGAETNLWEDQVVSTISLMEKGSWKRVTQKRGTGGPRRPSSVWPSFQPHEADGTGQRKQGPVKLGDVFAGPGWANRKLKPLWSSSLSSCCSPLCRGRWNSTELGMESPRQTPGTQQLPLTAVTHGLWILCPSPCTAYCWYIINAHWALGAGFQTLLAM